MRKIDRIKAEILRILAENSNISCKNIREKSSFLSEIYAKELSYSLKRSYSKAYFSKISFALYLLADEEKISAIKNSKDKREYLYSLK